MKKNIEAVRGTKDYLPKETIMRDYVKDVILSTYKNNGFMHIKTPILEDIELLGGSDSGDNTKLMFKVLKRRDKLDLTKSNLTEGDITDIGLRYDLTVPLARFYAGHSNDLPKPFKAIQIDEAFRAERPQKGRLRQFTQCDIDILGDSSINAEIEVITVAGETLTKLGFNDFTFKINDRKILNNLIEYCGFNIEDSINICISLDKLDKIGYDGVKAELINNEYNEENVDKIITILKNVKEKGLEELNNYDLNKENIERVKNIIDSINVLATNYKAEFDITIIRGQGYYTSTVMEVYLDGFNGACGGGGRYDNMIEKIVGISVPAIGFSIGYERVCLILSEREYKQNNLVLIYENDNNFIEVLKYANTLKNEYNVHTVLKAKNFTNQLNKLKDSGYNSFVFFNTKQIKSLD